MTLPITKESQLVTAGGSLIFFEAGVGNIVVILTGMRPDSVGLDSMAAGEVAVTTAAAGSGRFGPLATALSSRRRVISLSPVDWVEADDLMGSLHRAGIDRMSLVAIGVDAAIAIAMVLAAPESVDKLILLSPLNGSDAALARIGVPTLIMSGTRDSSNAPKMARQIRSLVPNSNLSLVYDAGSDIASDRPAVCFETVEDFLQRGAAYVVERSSMTLSP
jgi:pimeloyl-ACP methyl ester carboxylesterase